MRIPERCGGSREACCGSCQPKLLETGGPVELAEFSEVVGWPSGGITGARIPVGKVCSTS
ncbi:hypothetical protein [Nocardia sp. NPDC052316]|uniref:hypothetical protein n=1 Tax=Nocardia sp. NPDC052316 TaxID=3364329 RepID=UPI0037C66637